MEKNATMIHKYGISLIGVNHEKTNTVCQDAHVIIQCGDDMVIAAVADGVSCADDGSHAEYSDVASKKAVEISTSHCGKHIVQTDDAVAILKTIGDSFSEARSAIEQEAQIQGHDIQHYRTTLSLAVLINDTLYYGHSGDSGIIALTDTGLFEKVTEQQQDDQERVFCLSFVKKWVFGQFDKKVCSVLLATDGMLLLLLPPELKDDSVDINVNLAGYFMDNRSLCIDEQGEDTVMTRIKDYVLNVPPGLVNSDDLTIVVLVNTSIEPGTQPADYYKPRLSGLEGKQNDVGVITEESSSGEVISPNGNLNGVNLDDESVPESKDTQDNVNAKQHTKTSILTNLFGRFFVK
jgi:hypothetical protein